MAVYAPMIREMSIGDSAILSIDWSAAIASGDSLTGTPTAATSIPSGLTLGAVSVNSGTLTINDVDVLAGFATRCSVSGGTAGVLYSVVITALTTAGRTLIRGVRVQVV